MRLIFPIAAALSLAACASNPKPVEVPVQPVAEAPKQRGELIGMSAAELNARFGAPALQVREGDGTKLQFRAQRCILDAFLYPPASGAGLARVAHVDTRDREGRSVAAAACIAQLEAR